MCIVSLSTIKAQDISYGLIFGVNFYNDQSSSGGPNDVFFDSGNDYFILQNFGAYFEYGFNKNMGAKLEMSFNKKSFVKGYANVSLNETYVFNFIDINPNFKYDFGDTYRHGFYMLIGPKVAFLTNAEFEGNDVKSDFESAYLAIDLGMGQRFLNNSISMNIKILEIGFILRLIPREDILHWSDDNIVKGNNESIFIDLSSITSKDDDETIIDILKQNSVELAENDFYLFHRIFLSNLYQGLKRWENVQIKLIEYYKRLKDHFDEKEFEFWSRLKDDYELRKDGFTGCMSMPRELIQYFKSYKIENYEGVSLKLLLDNFDKKESCCK